MKRFLKVAGITAGVVVVLIITAVILVPMMVNINDYKDRIISVVEKQTGRKLKIQGNIELSVFPRMGVTLDTVELGNASGFEAPVFARVKQLRIRVRILPLLFRRLEADVVTVQGLFLALERNKDGRTNWDDLVTAKPEKPPEETEKPFIAPAALSVGGVDVRDASVTWTDRVSGQHIAVNDVLIKTSAVTLVDPVDVKIGFSIDTGDLGFSGRVDVGTRVAFDLNRHVIKVSDVKLDAGLKGKTIPGGQTKIKAEGAAALDTAGRRISLDRLKLEAGALSLPPYTADVILETAGSSDFAAQTFTLPALKVDVRMTAEKERIDAALAGSVLGELKAKKIILSDLTLHLPEFTTQGTRIQLAAVEKSSAVIDLAATTVLIDGVNIAGTISGKALPGGSLPVAFSFRVKGDFNRQSITVEPMQLEALGMKTAGRLLVSQFQTAPEIKGDFSVARLNPREMFSKMVKNFPVTSDVKALSSAELSVAFTADANSVKIDKLTARIDDSQLAGSASVSNFTAPNVRFDLGMDRLNLDRYLPPKHAGGKASPAIAAAGTGSAAGGISFEILRKLSLDGNIHIADFTASGIKMTSLLAGIRAKDGVLRTDPVKADLFEGAATGFAELDVRGKESKFTFDEKLSRVRLDRMLKALGVDTGNVDVGGSSTLTLKGTVAADAAFKLIRVEQLVAGGLLGGKLALGLDAAGTLLNLSEQTLTAESVKMSLDDMKVLLQTKVTGLLTEPIHKTEIRIPAFNLRKMLAKIGREIPETADSGAMTVFEATASVNGSGTAISMDSVKLRLDDTRLEGRVGITFGPVKSYALDMRIDDIDMDRYLPPKKKGRQPVASPPGTASAALPGDMLRAVDLEGKLALGKLKIANVRLQNIQAQAKGKDGLLTLNPLRAGLYGGTYDGNISLDARGKQLLLAVDEKLDKVPLGPLLKDFQGQAMLTGLTRTEAKLTATGADVETIRRTVNGNVEFLITDGSIEKLDIIGKICRTLSTLSAGSLTKEDIAAGVMQMISQKAKGGEKQSSDRTEFSEMRGSMVFTNGVGTNQDLILNSPLLRVEGGGKLDLAREHLDYQATVALVKSCEGQGGKSLRELANYPIPVTVSGPLDRLDVKPNLTAGILKLLGAQQPKEQPAAGPQILPSPQPQIQPSSPPQEPQDLKKLGEEAVKDMLQKGLQDVLKKK